MGAQQLIIQSPPGRINFRHYVVPHLHILAGDLRDVGQHARDAARGVRHPRPVPQPARQLRRPPRRRPRPLEGARHVQGRNDLTAEIQWKSLLMD